jgi:hypothetical protein
MNNAAISPPLASVLHLKVHEFARRPVLEQARFRAQLEAVIAVTIWDLAPEERIVLEASDGAAIVVFGNPVKALQIAERVLPAGAAGLRLRIGVNHGAVQLAADGGDQGGLIGDGIATAASVAEFATPASLLMTRSFRDALAEVAPALVAGLSPAGVFTDAGLRAHELFRQDQGAAVRRRRRFLVLGALAAVGFIAAGVVARPAMGDSQERLDRWFEKIEFSAGEYRDVLRDLIGNLKF